ncbi:MAG: rod shape-determining protein RodA [Chloroflexi bacterium]|nr:rod shape-determining protein RodA [Chloroflexota bacterium]
MRSLRDWRHFDLTLFGAAVLLVAYGLLMIYSATLGIEDGGALDSRVIRQAAYAAIGFCLLLLVSAMDYHMLATLAYAMYAVTIVLLTVVLITGQIFHGAQRWIDLGLFPLQPSEAAKLATALALARYLSDRGERIHQARFILRTLLFPAMPAALILAQPDVGTAAIQFAIWLGVIVVAGARFVHLGALLGATIALTPLAWLLMQDYMRKRVMIFLDPASDPLGAGYNVIQALIGVGSGGLLGRGFTSGTQSQLHFLRVKYADFIFSVLAEELGFVGAMVLLALFLVVLLRGLRVMFISADTFGRLTATGLLSAILLQVSVNIGMNIGLLPVTGVTLPLISYGGSSLLTVLVSLGVLESVAMRHRKFEF